jgi:hypothetical protein
MRTFFAVAIFRLLNGRAGVVARVDGPLLRDAFGRTTAV